MKLSNTVPQLEKEKAGILPPKNKSWYSTGDSYPKR